jgi:PAS domain S-box-containing protein
MNLASTFHSLFGRSSDLAFLLDGEGRVAEANPAAEAALPATGNGIAGEQLGALFNVPEIQPTLRKYLARCAAGETVRFEFEWASGSGARRHGEWTASLVTGGASTFLLIGREITEVKRAAMMQTKLLSLYRQVQELALVGGFQHDLRTGEIRASPQLGAIIGTDPARAARIEDLFAALHPEDRERVRAALDSAFRSGSRSLQLEYRIARPGGVVRHLAVLGAIEYDADGKPLSVTGAAQDITELRAAERQVRKLNRTHDVLREINRLAIHGRTADEILHGACRVAVEKAAFRLAWFGYLHPSKDGLVVVACEGGSSEVCEQVVEIVRPGGMGCTFTNLAVSTGRPAVCNDIERDPGATGWGERALHYGYRSMVALPVSVGHRIVGTINFYAAQPNYFDGDELQLLAELARDLSFALEVCDRERQREFALHELRASEERFRLVAETIEDVFWIRDPGAGRIVYLSPAFEKIWGASPAPLLESPEGWLATVHPDDRERVASAGLLAGTAEIEYRIVRPDGEVRWIRDRSFPVRNEGGHLVRVVGVARDITESRQLEDRLRHSQKMEAIGQLAGGVAHDFNNVLAAIRLQADLTDMIDVLPTEAREGLRQIRQSADRAAKLTRQLLLFSRRQVIQLRPLDLNVVVSNVSVMLQRLLGEKVRIDLHLHPAPLWAKADAGMLDQVLMNLALNARDAMGGSGRVLLETGQRSLERASADVDELPPGEYVTLAVSDSGCGVAPEVLPRIFDPFFTTKEPGKGTGLGLATVFGIVKQHHGGIRVETERGRGTTFIVLLPAATIAPPPRPPEAASQPPRGTETILLVEDDPAVRTATKSILSHFGYCVIDAGNGPDAIALWRRHAGRIALLLTDLVLPDGMDGEELAARLQQEDRTLPVLFVTGCSPGNGEHTSRRSSENVVLKPAAPDELLRKIRRMLDAKARPQ